MNRHAKWKRALEVLLTGRPLDRFQAASELSDHCLRSTIATIQKKGVPVSRRMEHVRVGRRTVIKYSRYWLERRHFLAARFALGELDEELLLEVKQLEALVEAEP